AAAWCRILQRDVDRGGAHLVTLARILADTASRYPSFEQKKRTANWLGETVGYLTGAGLTAGNTQTVARLQGTIEPIFDGAVRKAYEGGRTKSRRLFAEFEAIAARPEVEIRGELRNRRQRLLADLGTVEPKLAAARSALKLNRDGLA